MTTGMYLDNPSYVESERFILEGHQLLVRGESTLPKSPEEQHRMEGAWADLNESEAERLDGLAADLFMLLDEDRLQPLDVGINEAVDLRQRVLEALSAQHWDELLAVLRCGPTFLTRDQIALLRGQAWQGLGHDDVAMLFFDYAGKLKPDNARAQVLQLRTLLKLGRFEEARRRAQEYTVEEVALLDGSLPAAG